MSLSLVQVSLILVCLLISSIRLIQTRKPSGKLQQATWRLECELGVIFDIDCPADGAWAPWGPWSSCQGSCDDTGTRRRTRMCINPPPSEDGLPCSGPEEQSEPCFIKNCTVEDYRRLSTSDFGKVGAFRQLEAVPSLLERCLLMECAYEAIEEALASDNIWQLMPETLWNALQCVKHNVGCPEVGEWGTWAQWSPCGALCGNGFQWRRRRCDTPPPSAAHLICTGNPLEIQECEGGQCALDIRDIESDADGQWNRWGPWSTCSEDCGPGVRHRRRSCNDSKSLVSGPWGTHCAGLHEEYSVCIPCNCKLDGGWSGWGPWGPCSQQCSSGKRTRTRSCTRPIPAGGGTVCVGPRTEIGSCYIAPCEAYTHDVALLNGESSINYNFAHKRAVLFHFYVRFMPLSPHGTLVRRGKVYSPYVRLSLQKWHVCLDANGHSRYCNIARICSPTAIEPAVWHTALITITNEAVSLRIDDAKVPIKSTFPCDPELPDEEINILVGERFHGAIQEMTLNFIPLNMTVQNHAIRRNEFAPSSVTNVMYETAGIQEAFMTLENGQYLRMPCFAEQSEWLLDLTLKSKRGTGTILFLHDSLSDNWFYVGLQNMRLKLKIAFGDFRAEGASYIEYSPNQWLDVTIVKKMETNAIEAIINGGEKVHVVLEDETQRERRDSRSEMLYYQIMNLARKYNTGNTVKPPILTSLNPKSFPICSDEFFVGGVPANIKQHVKSQEITAFSGIIASVGIHNVLQDLHSCNVERYKDTDMQVSSRTASVSGSYHEVAWGDSNRLNLTCLHARMTRSPHTASWLFLDTAITGVVRDKTVRSIDDGMVLRLVASANNDLRGFYTCRAHTNKHSRNIVTYGVLGKIRYNLSSPDIITVLAVISTLLLIIGTLTWLTVEGIHDLRNGFGFFRDASLTPEEEAEAVCRYIDGNMDLVGSESLANLAKARARRKAHRLVSHASFAAQEPDGLRQLEAVYSSQRSDPNLDLSNSDILPALPNINNLGSESHDVYRVEPSYISSPCHGSNLTSPVNRLTSSSSLELTSPRVLCNRLLLAKRSKVRANVISKKKNLATFSKNDQNTRSNLFTIKSETGVELSPAQKVLHKFRQLKTDDE